MEGNTDKTPQWRGYFDEHKKVWYDPSISIYVKAFIRVLELHRSDSTGWSISIRRLSKLLNISTNTAMDAINEALRLGLVETDIKRQRKRRKLRLSVALRAPVTHKQSTTSDVYQQVRQPVFQSNTDSVSEIETVNNKVNLQNTNTEKSQVNQREKIEEPIPYRKENPQGGSEPEVVGESEGFKRLRERMKTLGWKEKS